MDKPLSSHWADQAAFRLIREWGERDSYVVASGITPSGTIHIGNFREEVTVDLVARALKDLGKKVRHIHSWDNFDTFRKVPKNLPNQEMLTANLRKPISRVPDPFGKEESYARFQEVQFENELQQVGIFPEYLSQYHLYTKGIYAGKMREALENKDKIIEILNRYRTEPLPADWLPTTIYCENCDRDQMVYEKFQAPWTYLYKCEDCGHEGETDIRTCKHLKLNWRSDWPMRWAYEQVDFEPGGKDHSSEGGSRDTGAQIIQAVWNRKPPTYLQYDFVSIKGMSGKMSSSKGELITLSEAFVVYTPQMVRWLFAMQRPNHDFSLAFDEDVIKTYEEFDRAEELAFAPPPEKDQPKWLFNRRCYELSLVNGRMPEAKPFRPSFRALCNHLQVCDGDWRRTWQRFYEEVAGPKADQQVFAERCEKAWSWLENHAPDEFRFRINAEPVSVETTPELQKALSSLRDLVKSVDLQTIETTDLNQKIFDGIIKAQNLDAKKFFQTVYTKLISRDRGPRLPSFLKEIGRDRLEKLLS